MLVNNAITENHIIYKQKLNRAFQYDIDIIPAVAAGLGGLLGSMYLDAKYLLSRDLHQIRSGAAGQL